MESTLEELTEKIEEAGFGEKYEIVYRIHGENSTFIIDQIGSGVGTLFKVKEGFYTVWARENVIRPIRYKNLGELEHCLKFNTLNKERSKIKLVSEAIAELEKKYRIKVELNDRKKGSK